MPVAAFLYDFYRWRRYVLGTHEKGRPITCLYIVGPKHFSLLERVPGDTNEKWCNSPAVGGGKADLLQTGPGGAERPACSELNHAAMPKRA
jgi:hypothetical protein